MGRQSRLRETRKLLRVALAELASGRGIARDRALRLKALVGSFRLRTQRRMPRA